jgi:hypothetical protein
MGTDEEWSWKEPVMIEYELIYYLNKKGELRLEIKEIA